MSNVTNIKTITNRLLYPVSVKNGENHKEIFTVEKGAGWNGDMWIPWVDGEGDMGKAIQLSWSPDNKQPDKRIYIFQHGDSIMYVWDNPTYDQKNIISGNSAIKGEKLLIVDTNTHVFLE